MTERPNHSLQPTRRTWRAAERQRYAGFGNGSIRSIPLFFTLLNETFHIVSKLEAAERQLRQAVRLFFQRGDDVAIHTLAAAAYQILSDLCEHKGIEREMEDSAILDEMGVKGEVLATTRKPQTFFMHADKDPEGTVRFNPLLSACLILSDICGTRNSDECAQAVPRRLCPRSFSGPARRARLRYHRCESEQY